MDGTKVPPRSPATELAGLLDSPEIGRLVDELEATRWTGRPGYPLRAMVGMALAKSMYAVPTWTRTVALVSEHVALREAIGGTVPSVYALLPLRREAPRLQRSARRLHRARHGLSLRRATRVRHGPRHRRLGHARLRQRSALPLEERARAPAVLRPGRYLGPSLGRLHTQGRRLLRLPPSRRLAG